MKSPIKILLLCLTWSLCSTQSQVWVDSLLSEIADSPDSTVLEIYRELFIAHMYADVSKAENYADALLAYSKNSSDLNLRAQAYNLKGVSGNLKQDYVQSRKYLKLSLAQFKDIGDMERASAILNNLANTERSLGNLKTALEMQMESVSIKEEVGADDDALAASYWNIGNLTGDIGNYTESNIWYRKAKTIYKALDSIPDVINLDVLIASNYVSIDSLDIAKKIFLEAIPFYESRGYNNDLAGIYGQLGNIAKRDNNLKLAEIRYLKALELSENNGERGLPGIYERNLASLYIDQGEHAKALGHAKKSLYYTELIGNRKKAITDYKVLAQSYSGLGNYRQAYKHHIEYHRLHDSILSQENIATMNELEVKYQSEQKEQQIALLKAETETQRVIKRSMITVAAILALLLLSLLYAYVQRKKRYQSEKQQQIDELNFKKNELTAFAMQLAGKNEILEKIKADLIKTKNADNNFQSVINTIDINLLDDDAWSQFKVRFEDLHYDFEKNLLGKFPELTPKDIRLISLLKMNLNSREIAGLLNISQDGIKKARYRLRKKLNLSSQDSLEEYILSKT